MKSGRLRCPRCKKRLVDASAPAPPAGDARRTAARRGDVAGGAAPAASASEPVGEEEGHLKAPWHFKLLAAGTVAYLIYRLIWFIFWLTGHAWHG
jgi:hypothetical protein